MNLSISVKKSKFDFSFFKSMFSNKEKKSYVEELIRETELSEVSYKSGEIKSYSSMKEYNEDHGWHI